MMSIWFSIVGLVLGLLGALFLSFDAFLTKKEIVSKSGIGRAPVLMEGETMQGGGFERAVERELQRQKRFAKLTLARVGVLLLSGGFLLQLIGILITLPPD